MEDSGAYGATMPSTPATTHQGYHAVGAAVAASQEGSPAGPDATPRPRRVGVAAAALTLSLLALVVGAVLTGSNSSILGEAEAETGELVSAVTSVENTKTYSSFTNFNVLFLMIDDMGHNDFGMTSQDMGKATPTLDSLAKKGVILDNYYTQASCTPARVAFLTGRYPSNVGMGYDSQGAFTTTTPYGVPLKYKTIGDLFHSGGYRTVMIGKWNIGHFEEAYLPHRRGFDSCLMYNSDAIHYYNYSSVPSLFNQLSPTDMLEAMGDGKPYDLYKDLSGTYTSELFVDRAINEFGLTADSDDSDPLFMYLAFQAVHTPHNHPPSSLFNEETDTYKLKHVKHDMERYHFGKTLVAMDTAIKKLWDHIVHLGLDGKTIIAAASDNGACPEDGGSNFPLRGGKFGSFEGGVKVPSFVYSPEMTASVRGSAMKSLVHVTDWAPTLLKVVGITDDYVDELDGIDQHKAMFHGYDEGVRDHILLRMNRWEEASSTLANLEFDDAYLSLRWNEWKIILNEHRPKVYDDSNSHNCSCDWSEMGAVGNHLYNIEEDPNEVLNRYSELPDLAANMTKMLRKYYDEAPASEFQAAEDDLCIDLWSTEYGGKGYVEPWHKPGASMKDTTASR